jgi:excisionase family DNA binding protein
VTKRDESLKHRTDPRPHIVESQVLDRISEKSFAIGQLTEHRRMISVAEFCRLYGIGKTMAYAEMLAGRLRFCKVGRSRRIRMDDAEAWSISTRQTPPTDGMPSTAGGV